MLAAWTGAEQDETALAPRGWFGIAAMNRTLAERRLVQDMQMLTSSGSVQAACLDCRAYLPPVPAGSAEAKGLIGMLAFLWK